MEVKCKFKTIDGFKISGIYSTSPSNSRLILMLHGITVNKDEYLCFFKDGANYLLNVGINSLRFDFRGHGSSSGTSLDLTVVGQMYDIEAALQFLSSKFDLNQGLNVLGCSFGAPPAVFLAARYPQIIKSVILISPVLSYKRTFLAPETEWGKSIFNDAAFSQLKQKKKLFIDDKFPIGIRLVEEMKIIRPDLEIGELQQRIIVIHGDADSMVPYKVSQEIASKFPSFKLITMPSMDHGFMDISDESGTGSKSLENKNRIFKMISENCL